MALVDKHKVKRQRLDRICEGETAFLSSATPAAVHGCILCVCGRVRVRVCVFVPVRVNYI